MTLRDETMRDPSDTAHALAAVKVLSSKSSQNTPSMTQMGSGTFIPHRDSVRGFIYDVETGKLREVA